VLTPEQKAKIEGSLRLADGLMQTVAISSSASEYEMRNSMSRLYYAFFHVSLALLRSIGADTDKFSRDHGKVHAAVQARMGKYLGTCLKRLYHLRKLCDYDANMFEREYGRNIESARRDLAPWIRREATNFHWLYREARKALKDHQ
jgi:uncharacterized protein (UPF0332 family)